MSRSKVALQNILCCVFILLVVSNTHEIARSCPTSPRVNIATMSSGTTTSSLYPYAPDHTLPAVFAALVGLSFLLHIWQNLFVVHNSPIPITNIHSQPLSLLEGHIFLGLGRCCFHVRLDRALFCNLPTCQQGPLYCSDRPHPRRPTHIFGGGIQRAWPAHELSSDACSPQPQPHCLLLHLFRRRSRGSNSRRCNAAVCSWK